MTRERAWPVRRGHRTTAPVPATSGPSLEELMTLVARGDESAFEQVYDQLSGPLFGLVQLVLRDPAQSEEVTQEVLVELWRTATRYQPERGSVRTWAMTLGHRRAVDRVRSAQATAEREHRVAGDVDRPFDVVSDEVGNRMEREQVRRCMDTLTELQRESVVMAYYGGYTYREVAQLLDAPLGTVKIRLRDGLIRLRDCLGVAG